MTLSLLATPSASAAMLYAGQFYASKVLHTVVGTNQNSSFSLTAKALGGPRGAGALSGSFDVYNLGVGGSITLGFDTASHARAITDQTGADFIVFGNGFYAGGNPHTAWAKLLFVEVSTNGVNYARFPVTSNTPDPIGPYGSINPANVSGFAGVHPTLANVDTNTIDPFDPGVAGGDAFDLSALANDPLVQSGAVNLQDIREIRLVDVLGDGSLLDRNDHPIYDPSGAPYDIGGNVDAVAVIHGIVAPEPGSAALLGVAVIVLLLGATRRVGARGSHTG